MSKNSNYDSKTNAALRLLEAFSGVDEELLERCGLDAEAPAADKAPAAVVPLRANLWKYGKACAAVLCLGVVLSLGWTGMRMNGNDSAAEAILENATPEMARDEAGNEAASSAAVFSTESQFAYSGAAGTEETSGAGGAAKDVGETKEGALTDDLEKKRLMEEDIRSLAIVGEYVPQVLPEGYVYRGAVYDGDTENPCLTVSWSKGEETIELKIVADMADVIMQAESVKIESAQNTAMEEETSVCAWEDFSLDYVKEHISAGQFTVLYPDGVTVHFSGRATAEEIYDLFNSLE